MTATADALGGLPDGLLERVRQRLVRDGAVVAGPTLRAAMAAETALVADDHALDRLGLSLAADLTGAGPLEALLRDPDVTDVLVNGPTEVWIDRGSGLERAAVAFADEAQVRALAVRLAAAAGRRLDDASPHVDAQLPDGARLHAVLPPLAGATTVCVRSFRRRLVSIGDLVSAGTFDRAAGQLLEAVIAARLAFVISGGTGTGKTTVLGALLGLVAPTERIVIVEDAPELRPAHPHVVSLRTRAANIEGAGAIGPAELVRQALRMRPDRLVVGEFRGGEAMELLAALNTGHEGAAATIHANSAAAVPARFEALGALAGIDRAAVHSQLIAAIEVVLHLRRDPAGRRRLHEIGVLERGGDGLEVVTVWSARLQQWGPRSLNARSRLACALADRGVAVPPALGP
ncbi:MAG: pilus assembly protein CpaF [Pseudonocardiales bacterium]|nr:pilus assembly protein CpaF [Pseudonocardiales bacterium]